MLVLGEQSLCVCMHVCVGGWVFWSPSGHEILPTCRGGVLSNVSVIVWFCPNLLGIVLCLSVWLWARTELLVLLGCPRWDCLTLVFLDCLLERSLVTAASRFFLVCESEQVCVRERVCLCVRERVSVCARVCLSASIIFVTIASFFGRHPSSLSLPPPPPPPPPYFSHHLCLAFLFFCFFFLSSYLFSFLFLCLHTFTCLCECNW